MSRVNCCIFLKSPDGGNRGMLRKIANQRFVWVDYNFRKLSCAIKVHDFMLRINIVASEKLNRASEDVT